MQANYKDKAYLWDIREACKEILEFIEGVTFLEFTNKKIIRYAVERQILVIGEAANHLSQDFLDNHQEIPWKKIIGMRNIIAHEYGEILVERVWLTAKNHIENLLLNVDNYLKNDTILESEDKIDLK